MGYLPDELVQDPSTVSHTQSAQRWMDDVYYSSLSTTYDRRSATHKLGGFSLQGTNISHVGEKEKHRLKYVPA